MLGDRNATSVPHDGQRPRDLRDFTIRNTVPKFEQTFLAIGSTIGKYRVIAEVNRGGMAVVYRAMQLDLQREVALKVIPAAVSISPRFLERFISEAHAASKLNHPNIVAIHEIANEQGIYFLVMDYIKGRNLFQYLHEAKPKIVDVLRIVAELADALAYAHRNRIIHRDLKLNNVIMKDDTTPVVIDFGLAKAMEDDAQEITRTGELVGSPAYMAPERILGGVSDHRGDICSLGIMLYEMLTFKNPYLDPRSIHQTALNVVEANPVPPRRLVTWLPREVEAITLKAMHGDPQRRYQSMEELRDDIRRYERGEYVHAQPPSILTRLLHFVRRRWPYLAMAGLVALFSAIFGLVMYRQSQKGRTHWQVMVQERFSDREAEGWTPFRGGVPDTTAWQIAEGTLAPRGAGPVWIRLDNTFTRDVRVEFEVHARGGDLHDAGAFLYGYSPQDAYRVHLYRGPTGEHGISPPGSDLLISEYDPASFPARTSHAVEIERRDRQISLWIDRVLIARLVDCFPPLGERHQHMGFFATGESCLFDNLRVSQLAIPLAPNPTLIAERFWERGDMLGALDEYRALKVEIGGTEFAREVHLRIPDCLIRLGRSQEALEQLTRGPLLRFGTEAAQSEALFLGAMAEQRLGNQGAADSVLLDVCMRFPATQPAMSAAVALVRRATAALAGDLLPAAVFDPVESLAQRDPRFWPMTASVQRGLVLRCLERGQLDRAQAVCRRMAQVYADNGALSALAQQLAGLVALCRRERKAGVDILNRCVASHQPSEGVWEAWMLLASVYEYDQNYRDALTIYRKVYRECPHGYHLAWMARIKMAEIGPKAGYEESPQSVLRDVVEQQHPFPLPRGIARYYLGQIGDTEFTDLWHAFYPGDWYFLYHMARKALAEGEAVIAEIYLQQLLQTLPPTTWRAFIVYQMLAEMGTR